MCVWKRQGKLKKGWFIPAAAVQRSHATGTRRLLAPRHLRDRRTRVMRIIITQNTVHTKLQLGHRINITIQRRHCHSIPSTNRHEEPSVMKATEKLTSVAPPLSAQAQAGGVAILMKRPDWPIVIGRYAAIME